MRVCPTGSRVHRVWKCPPSAVLPQVVEDESRYEPARNKGRAIHAYLERVKAIGEIAAQAEATLSREQAMKICECFGLLQVEERLKDNQRLLSLLKALDISNLPVDLATEVAFAWNWRLRTARELGRNLNRNYEQVDPPIDWGSEIPCTLDVVGVAASSPASASSRGYVGDYKSGHSKYPPPDAFGQTLLGASCVRSAYGADDCVVELIHIHDDGDHHRVRRIVDGWDLDVFERELQAAMGYVEHWEEEYADGRAVAATEGAWCDYCPAYMACPAKVALVRRIPAELAQLGIEPDPATGKLELRQGMISVRNAADAWMVLEQIAEAVNKAKEQVIGIASFEDIALPDGRVIGRQLTEKRQLNANIAAEVLERRYGRETRDAAVKITMSLEAVHHAVVANIRPGEKIQTKKEDGVLDRVLADIEAKGGLATKTTESIRPYVPKKIKS